MDNHIIRQQLQDAYQKRVAMRVYQDKKFLKKTWRLS